MKKVIAIGGLKRSGKSTLADFLIRQCAIRGWQVQEVSFAQPIKDMLKEVFRHEVPYNTFTDDSRKQDKVEIAPGVYMTVRELLQKVGTDCFREVIHKDFWITRGMAKIKAAPDVVIVPDIRFPNELEVLSQVPNTTIYIDRPGLEREEDLHPSETNLLQMRHNFDYCLVNSEDDLSLLENFAKSIIKAL